MYKHELSCGYVCVAAKPKCIVQLWAIQYTFGFILVKNDHGLSEPKWLETMHKPDATLPVSLGDVHTMVVT